MSAKLGLAVIYHAHLGHKMPHPSEGGLHGSVHHPEQHEFHAHVTRVHKDGSVDLVFFPPGRDPKHAERVKEGPVEGGDHYWTEQR